MKEIYWIDDDFVQMKYIAQGAISKLWNLNDSTREGIRSKIILFGNAYMEDERKWEWNKLSSQRERDIAYEELNCLYEECCFRLDGPNQDRPIFNENRELVHGAVIYLLNEEKREDVELYDDICQTWGEGTSSGEKTERDQKIAEQTKKLIERMNLSKDAVVGIDLSLMCGDIERIRNGQKVLSMELYRQLKKKKFKCFLYSAQGGEYEFSSQWKQTYIESYAETEEPDDGLEDTRIYERSDFLSKGSEDIVLQLRQLLNT